MTIHTYLQKQAHSEPRILQSFPQWLFHGQLPPVALDKMLGHSPRISFGGKTTPSGGLLTSSGSVGVFPFVVEVIVAS